MDSTLWPLLTAGFGIALVHAALPTHWLPFVLAARAQRWSEGKTLAVTAAAGGGHAAFTALLGVIAVVAGAAVDQWSRDVFPWIAGAVLAGFGLFYLSRFARGHGHSHLSFVPLVHGHDHHSHHDHHGHAHDDDQGDPHPHPHPNAPRSDAAVILGLLAMLSLSPCEGFLPVFIAGAREGWLGYLWLSAALTAATLAGMLAFTWLSLRGLQHLKLERLARYEHAIVGGMLLAMGVAVWVFET